MHILHKTATTAAQQRKKEDGGLVTRGTIFCHLIFNDVDQQ